MLYLKDNLLKKVKHKSFALGKGAGGNLGVDGEGHVEIGEAVTYIDNPLIVLERKMETDAAFERENASDIKDGDSDSVSKHEYQRVIEQKEMLTHENCTLKEKERAHDREMDSVRAEKRMMEERASKAEAELSELKAKLQFKTELL